MTTITRNQFVGAFQNTTLDVNYTRSQSTELANIVTHADRNFDGRIDQSEAGDLFNRIDAFDNNGSFDSLTERDTQGALTYAGWAARSSMSLVDVRIPMRSSNVGIMASFTPNTAAVESARTSSIGRNIHDRAPLYQDIYAEVERVTGVPAQMVVAIHANESQLGAYNPDDLGPESGFGLDDRWVSTEWGNEILANHGYGNWDRGGHSDEAILQSAIIAAEHFKRNAGYADIEVSSEMSSDEIAGAITAYVAGPRAGRRANDNGRSFMFDPADDNPHPLHPGGTSRTSQGTVQVDASRKPGLLRWDVLLVLADESLHGNIG